MAMLCVIWLTLLLTYKSEGNEENEQYVIGGRNASPGQFPYVGYISTFDNNNPGFFYSCTATIIDSRWVLTAAHCYKENHYSTFDVGTIYQSGPSDAVYDIEKFVLHEGFRSSDRTDLALAKIRGNIVFTDRVKKINLPDGETPTGTRALFIGFGDETRQGAVPKRSGHLKFINAKVLSHNDCSRSLDHIYPNEICSSTAPNSGVCLGDSGGPLIVNDKIVGVQSRRGSIACASQLPDLYTGVYKNLDWIKAQIK